MIRAAIVLLTCLALAGCGSKFKTYNGPEVTRVVVMKSDRKMYLLHGRTVLRAYDIDLGFAPVGHKQFRGDGRTPEGSYFIDRRNPKSQFHLSLGISYPSMHDSMTAQEAGQDPGGDIFVHGRSAKYRDAGRDWTAGCISVKDPEIEEIYAMVKDGTQIDIHR